MDNKVELLAPVGKIENAYAAVENGADAIFFGGNSFNARVNADNFDYVQMKELINYCKLRGVKTYVTVNTLVRENELVQVYQLLKELQNLGIDAIIVQDLGIVNMVRKYFSNLKMHASTQLSAHSYEDVLFLKENGMSRVVLARELSLAEIIKIKKEVDIEIETFVHGALCFSYSGQCLLSSVIGDRSGNRGSCAQPCRMMYSLYKNNECIADDMHLLSSKDICTLEILPDLIKAGIDSFKIEGRMKSAEYVAGVVGTYRKYLDNVSYAVDQMDIDNLKAIFNRGNFSTGYYKQKPGVEMMSQISPKNIGLKIGKVIKYDKKTKMASIYTKYDLNKGDGIEVWNSGKHVGIGLNKDYKKNGEFGIKLDYAQPEAEVYITKKHNLIKSLRKTYEKQTRKRKIDAYFLGRIGKPIALSLTCQNIKIQVFGEPLEEAINAPIAKVQIEEKLRKLGNTPFEIESIEINLDENVFLSIAKMNDLKRIAVEKLMAAIVKVDAIEVKEYVPVATEEISAKVAVQVSTKEQLEAVLEFEKIDTIYYPFDYKFDKCVVVIELVRNVGKKIVVVLPQIMSSELLEKYKGDLLELAATYEVSFLCKTLGQVNLLSRLGIDFEVDYNLNVCNSEHAEFYKNLGARQITLSQEVYNEVGFQKVIYGYYPVMTSKQCLLDHVNQCGNKDNFYIEDRKNVNWMIKTDCEACVMQIFSCKPVQLRGFTDNVRLDFTIESVEEIRKIIREFIY